MFKQACKHQLKALVESQKTNKQFFFAKSNPEMFFILLPKIGAISITFFESNFR